MNCTKINTIKTLYPSFPLKCDFCTAQHKGNIDQAIDDGWNIIVFDTKSDGLVQIAGCSKHKDEQQGKALAYMKSKSQQN